MAFNPMKSSIFEDSPALWFDENWGDDEAVDETVSAGGSRLSQIAIATAITLGFAAFMVAPHYL